jgi:GNAT superfamily N-acetyltransferase
MNEPLSIRAPVIETTLADGTELRIRSIMPEDRDELTRRIAEASPETRFRRFFSPTFVPSEAMLRYLTEVDGERHAALVALVPTDDMKGWVGVGVARYVREDSAPSGDPVAEAAVTVLDGYQARGIGTRLMLELAALARQNGIVRFRAHVVKGNTLVQGMLLEHGAQAVAADDEAATFDVLIEKPGYWRELIRQAASTLAFVIGRRRDRE